MTDALANGQSPRSGVTIPPNLLEDIARAAAPWPKHEALRRSLMLRKRYFSYVTIQLTTNSRQQNNRITPASAQSNRS